MICGRGLAKDFAEMNVAQPPQTLFSEIRIHYIPKTTFSYFLIDHDTHLANENNHIDFRYLCSMAKTTTRDHCGLERRHSLSLRVRNSIVPDDLSLDLLENVLLTRGIGSAHWWMKTYYN